jgi:RHS repeat-associated protein
MPRAHAHVDDGYFDGCGNSIELQPGSQQPLIWNGRNGLAAVTLVARTQSAQSDREAYQYDGSGQRLRKTTLRYKDNGKTCQRDTVIYLPGVEIRRRETLSVGSEATLNEELHLLSGSGGRAGVQTLHWTSGRPADMSNDAMRVSLGDQIGSATLELDGDARIITLEEYYPYGGTAVSSAASQSEADYKFRRYSGEERDATGLYYYGQRYYQPCIGRWLNPDPAGTIDGRNLFRMVRNNPVTLRDDDGRVGDNPFCAGSRTSNDPINRRHSNGWEQRLPASCILVSGYWPLSTERTRAIFRHLLRAPMLTLSGPDTTMRYANVAAVASLEALLPEALNSRRISHVLLPRTPILIAAFRVELSQRIWVSIWEPRSLRTDCDLALSESSTSMSVTRPLVMMWVPSATQREDRRLCLRLLSISTWSYDLLISIRQLLQQYDAPFRLRWTLRDLIFVSIPL